MTAGDIIAIYAAVVATGAAGWEVFTWRHSRSTRVHVHARMALAPIPSQSDSVTQLVAINVVNRSERAVRVTGVGLVLQDGTRREIHIINPVVPGTVPGEVPAYDSGSAYIAFEEVKGAGIDVMKPVTAWARLSTNERITSKAEPLMTR